MKRFKNILAAVDASPVRGDGSGSLPPPSEEAVERALWLAKANEAKLTFFYAVDLSSGAQRALEESEEQWGAVVGEATASLQSLQDRAGAEGVSAGMEVKFGKGWIEIIRQVLRGRHDLVVAGSRKLSPVRSLFAGSTGIKLLRKCPCPVWITRPQPHRQIKSVLVAHCLRPVGDIAMELGSSLAQLQDAQLHVLHSLEFAELEGAFPERVPAEKSAEFRRKAEQHIQSQLAKIRLAHPPQVHITTDAPDFAVLELVEDHNIELVVMGTIARTGIPGFITGNTAEQLLPLLRCSVLAVKPPSFVSPVSL